MGHHSRCTHTHTHLELLFGVGLQPYELSGTRTLAHCCKRIKTQRKSGCLLPGSMFLRYADIILTRVSYFIISTGRRCANLCLRLISSFALSFCTLKVA